MPPVEPRDGMDAAFLPARAVIRQQPVCERALIAARRRVRQHPRGLIQRDERLVLIQDGERHLLRLKALDRLVEPDSDRVAGMHRMVRVDGLAVYEQRVLPFEP